MLCKCCRHWMLADLRCTTFCAYSAGFQCSRYTTCWTTNLRIIEASRVWAATAALLFHRKHAADERTTSHGEINLSVRRPYRPITLDRNGEARYQSGYLARARGVAESSWRRRCGRCWRPLCRRRHDYVRYPARRRAVARQSVERNQFLLLHRRNEHNDDDDDENERKRKHDAPFSDRSNRFSLQGKRFLGGFKNQIVLRNKS